MYTLLIYHLVTLVTHQMQYTHTLVSLWRLCDACVTLVWRFRYSIYSLESFIALFAGWVHPSLNNSLCFGLCIGMLLLPKNIYRWYTNSVLSVSYAKHYTAKQSMSINLSTFQYLVLFPLCFLTSFSLFGIEEIKLSIVSTGIPVIMSSTRLTKSS